MRLNQRVSKFTDYFISILKFHVQRVDIRALETRKRERRKISVMFFFLSSVATYCLQTNFLRSNKTSIKHFENKNVDKIQIVSLF